MSLESDIQTLETKRKALDDELKELKRLRDLAEKQVTVNIHKFNSQSGKIYVTLSKADWAIVDHLRDWNKYPERFYSNNENVIYATHIPMLESFLSNLEHVTVIWEKKAKEVYTEWLTAPDVFVDISKSFAVLKFGPKMVGREIHLTNEISSYNRDIISNEAKFSAAELFKFPKAIEGVWPKLESVKYSEEAEKELLAQLDKRKTIAELANAMDTEMDNPFPPESGFDLKGHQRVGIKFVELAGGRTIIGYDMGTGKTFIGMGYAERHPEFKRVLIICPASLKTNWKRHIKKATGIDATVFSGIEPDDLSVDCLVDNKSRYYIINFDIIGRKIGEVKDKSGQIIEEGVMKWVELFNIFEMDLIIIDEAHYIKNLDSKRSQGVRKLKFKNVLPMTGTPVVNRPMELWPLLHIVDPNTFSSASQFASQFIDADGKPRNTAKLHEMMLPYMIRRTREDVYGKLHIERIPWTKELSPQARINYDKIMAGIYVSLRRPEREISVTSILAELVRCKQTCANDNVTATVELAKDAYDETGKKVIICSQFKEAQYAIENLIGTSAVVVNGDVTDDQRYNAMDKFQDPDSSIKFWITNILEGLTLTEAHTVIFNDLWWTPKDHSQLEGRAFGRINDPHGGNAYYIQNEHTIDEMINALLLQKIAIINELVDGIKANQDEQGDIVSQLIRSLREGM